MVNILNDACFIYDQYLTFTKQMHTDYYHVLVLCLLVQLQAFLGIVKEVLDLDFEVRISLLTLMSS